MLLRGRIYYVDGRDFITIEGRLYYARGETFYGGDYIKWHRILIYYLIYFTSYYKYY